MAALVATSGETVEVLFGPGWQPVAPIFAWLGLAGLVQPITWAVTWLLVAQGRTATMFRWGAYASSTAVLSFAIGLRWGAVGVACAYAVGEYVLRSLSLYLTVQRVGPSPPPISLRLQGPLLAAAGLTVLISNEILRPYALSGIYLVTATVALSYGLAAGFLALYPGAARPCRRRFRCGRSAWSPPWSPGSRAAVLRRSSWRMFSRTRSSEDPRPGKCLQAAADQNHFSKPTK